MSYESDGNDMDEVIASFAEALSTVLTVEHGGKVYIDADTIPAINEGIVRALTPLAAAGIAPPNFLRGVVFALDMYRRVHVGVMTRHAADLVPDHIPDGMDGMVE